MAAVQSLTGGGGWPMTVWLTPDRKPFYGGTYFPPRDGVRGAGTGFLTLLQRLDAIYREDPQRVVASADQIASYIPKALGLEASGVPRPRLRGFRGDLRRRAWGFRRCAEISKDCSPRVRAPVSPPDRERASAPDGREDPGRNGARRNPRSRGRRVSPLFDRPP